MQRRQFLKNTSVALAATLAGCGGGDGGVAAQGLSGSSRSGTIAWPGAGPSFNGLPTLTLAPDAKRDRAVHRQRSIPLQGLVPTGQGLDSPDDPSARSTVISRWPDGSASVVVVAGETGVTLGTSKQIRLRAAAAGLEPVDGCQSGSTRFQCDGRLRCRRLGDVHRLYLAVENLVGQRASHLLPLSRAGWNTPDAGSRYRHPCVLIEQSAGGSGR